MKKCRNNELELVIGGATISASLINAFTNIIKVLMDAGNAVGSSIRRVVENDVCSLN